jgi:hypothetical protein
MPSRIFASEVSHGWAYGLLAVCLAAFFFWKFVTARYPACWLYAWPYKIVEL